jgi:Ca2+-binding EF-hand superfamily protein
MFDMGIPHSWEQLDKLPTAGVFTATYRCAPEDRIFKRRMDMLEEYGYWTGLKELAAKHDVKDVAAKHVMWWASVDDVPDDVFEFLLFVLTSYRDVDHAFRTMDRHKRGNISFDEFQAGVEKKGTARFEVSLKRSGTLQSKLEIQKQEEEAEEKRLRTVFGYLDSGGEGSLSTKEFQILQEMWQEIRLSIIQFVGFIDRMFCGDLKIAWHHFDREREGEITAEKWRKACDRSGYCGPVKPIWRFLDYNDNGKVSFTEFKLLDKFRVELSDRDCFRILREAREKLLEGVPEGPEEEEAE